MDFDVVIAGGGLNGSALAVALGQSGLRVAIIDPLTPDHQKSDGFDGRSYALALASKRALASLGLWQGLHDFAQPILEIKVSDGRLGEPPSPFVLEFDHAEIEEGPMGFLVEDRHLRPVLLDAVSDLGITVLSGQSVVSQTPRNASISVTTDDGSEHSARLLIGADGANSQTAMRAGINYAGWSYGQTSLVAAIEHERPHNGIAHQLFLPPGPLAILPLNGNRSSIVWTECDDVAKRINQLDDQGYLEELRPRFGDFLGDISLAGNRFSYPLALSVAESFSSTRVALIGDAAHRVHPLAGQGLNAGIKDVATLAQVVIEAKRRGEDIGAVDVLGRYEQWRRLDVTSLAVATDSFNKIFSNDNSLLRAGRDIGMSLANAFPSVRRSFIREAAGLTGDLPSLLRGRAI